MGTNLSTIITSRELDIGELSNKKLGVDSFNMLYQFLSTIRQQDGSLLTDSKGRVTSHLSGLFFRSTFMLKNNIKLAFVFDGVAPDLKQEERERRRELKKEAGYFFKYILNMKTPGDYLKLVEEVAIFEREAYKREGQHAGFFDYYLQRYLKAKPKLFIYGTKDQLLMGFLRFGMAERQMRLEKYYESWSNAVVATLPIDERWPGDKVMNISKYNMPRQIKKFDVTHIMDNEQTDCLVLPDRDEQISSYIINFIIHNA